MKDRTMPTNVAKKPTQKSTTVVRDLEAGYRRIQYDAMSLSASLVAVKRCDYFDSSAEQPCRIDAEAEAHHTNALVQIRSMVDFLTCRDGHKDDIMASDFGCTKQTMD